MSSKRHHLCWGAVGSHIAAEGCVICTKLWMAHNEGVAAEKARAGREYAERAARGKRRGIDDDGVALSASPTDTQIAAAKRALPASGSKRRHIYDLICEAPRTDDEIERLTGWTHQVASAARNALVLDGHIVDSGERRENRRGNSVIVWRKVDLAPHPDVAADDDDSRDRTIDLHRDRFDYSVPTGFAPLA